MEDLKSPLRPRFRHPNATPRKRVAFRAGQDDGRRCAFCPTVLRAGNWLGHCSLCERKMNALRLHFMDCIVLRVEVLAMADCGDCYLFTGAIWLNSVGVRKCDELLVRKLGRPDCPTKGGKG